MLEITQQDLLHWRDLTISQNSHTMSTSSTTADESQANNPLAPPSSAEEAAALLGASISLDNASFYTPANPSLSNPPVGMHSIFTVQSPIPNGVLFVRLCNLREWLRWHHDASVGRKETEHEHDSDEWDAFFKENDGDVRVIIADQFQCSLFVFIDKT